MPQKLIFVFIVLLVALSVLANMGTASAGTPQNGQVGIQSQASGPGSGTQRNSFRIQIGSPGAATQPNVGTQGVAGRAAGVLPGTNQPAAGAQQGSNQPATQQPSGNQTATSQQSGAQAPAAQQPRSGNTQANTQQRDQPVIQANSQGMPVILIRYTVQPGDSLSSLATRYHSTVDLIQRQNRDIITDPNRIIPGTVIYIPDP